MSEFDIGNTIRQNAVKGLNAAKEYMDTKEPTIQAGRAFMQPDAPGGRAINAVRDAIPTERGIVEGIGGATDAVVGGLSTLGDGVVEGGRLVSVGANQLLDNASSAYSQAAPYFSAAAKGASGGLNAIASNAAEGARELAPNFTTATTPPEGAPLLDRSRLLSGGDARLPSPHRVGDTGISYLGAVGDAVSRGASAVGGPLYNAAIGGPTQEDIIPMAKSGLTSAFNAVKDWGGKVFDQSGSNSFTNTFLAPGAQAGIAANQGADPTAVYTGERNPGDAPKPVTEGLGANNQDKANDAMANQSPVSGNTAYGTSTSPTSQAQASHENYRESVGQATNGGFNPPGTAPVRLPSAGQEIANPLGGGQLNTTGGVVSASSARSAPGDAPYLGGGNAPLSRATGRTTGDGSSNPNSPNFKPQAFGGGQPLSRDQWLAQRSAEKSAVRQRRDASNRRDEARRAQEARAVEFKEMVDDLPKGLSEGRRAQIIAQMYGDYLGSNVKSSGQDKNLQVANQRNTSNENIARAKLGADADQDAMSNQAAAKAAAAKAQEDAFEQRYKNRRVNQYQATIDATAARNAVLQNKAEYDIGFDYARNQREALAAQRAGLKLASDMNVQSVGLPHLGNYQANLNTVADLSGASPEQMEEFRKQNPQRY